MTEIRVNSKQELFEQMVDIGFEPLKVFIERKRLHSDLSEKDIEKIIDNIGFNLNAYVSWLRHQDEHIARGRE